MPKFPKNYKSIQYYVKGRKRPICGSTTATNDFLVLVHEKYPTLTINDLKRLISDKRMFIPNYEAIGVLDNHVKAGYGDYVPTWK